MATKQTSLRAAKQAKRQTRAKDKRKIAAIQYAKVKTANTREAEEKRMMAVIAELGPVEAARRIYKHRKKKGTDDTETAPLTNKDIMQNINEVIVVLIRVHSGVEVFCRMAAEKRFEISAVQQELINLLDEQIVRVTENVNVISTNIEGGREPEDYQIIFIDYTHSVAQLTEQTIPAIVDMLESQKDIIDQYSVEHCGHNPMWPFMNDLHCARMNRVVPLYARKVTAQPDLDTSDLVQHDYTPDNPMPSDPIIDDDVSDAVFSEANAPLLQEDQLNADLAAIKE